MGTFSPAWDGILHTYIGHHHSPMPVNYKNSHFNILEMWAILAATAKWCENWHKSLILFITDSTTVLAALATGRSKCAAIMELLCY